jgi:hypothetical protein
MNNERSSIVPSFVDCPRDVGKIAISSPNLRAHIIVSLLGCLSRLYVSHIWFSCKCGRVDLCSFGIREAEIFAWVCVVHQPAAHNPGVCEFSEAREQNLVQNTGFSRIGGS